MYFTLQPSIYLQRRQHGLETPCLSSNTLQSLLRNPNLECKEKSGIYEISYKACGKKYVGQTNAYPHTQVFRKLKNGRTEVQRCPTYRLFMYDKFRQPKPLFDTQSNTVC